MTNKLRFALIAAAVATVSFTSSGFAQSPNNNPNHDPPPYPLGHIHGFPNVQEGSGSAASRFQKQNGYYDADESPGTELINQKGARLFSYAGPRRNARHLHFK
jgi:hypothetical protein